MFRIILKFWSLSILHSRDGVDTIFSLCSLDRLLHGGLREGTVTELVGSSSSGKTQVSVSSFFFLLVVDI